MFLLVLTPPSCSALALFFFSHHRVRQQTDRNDFPSAASKKHVPPVTSQNRPSAVSENISLVAVPSRPSVSQCLFINDSPLLYFHPRLLFFLTPTSTTSFGEARQKYSNLIPAELFDKTALPTRRASGE